MMAFKPLTIFSLQMYDNYFCECLHSNPGHANEDPFNPVRDGQSYRRNVPAP